MMLQRVVSRQQHHGRRQLNRRLSGRLQFSSSAATVIDTTNDRNNANEQPHPLYPKLFSPLDLGNGIVLPNRAIMGSMHTGLESHSVPSWAAQLFLGEEKGSHSLDRMATYFQRRAEGNVGLLVTGGIAPNAAGWVGPFASQLTSEREAEMHQVVTEAVHTANDGQEHKSRICLQILHTGRYAYHPLAVSASSTKSPISPFPARALSAAGIQQTIDDYVRTAELACSVGGYDGVEIMGSEGYLLSQFLSPRTNQRTDTYGGESIENRARLAVEIVQATRAACGP